MPSEMSPPGSSASYFPDERQTSAWKMNDVAGYYGLKTDEMVRTGIASPALENRIPPDFQMEKGFDLPNYYLSRGRNANHSTGKHHLVGAEGAASRSLPSAVDHHLAARRDLNLETASYCLDGDKINLVGAQHENSLFSSSLSDLFARKLKLPGNNEVYGHSVGAAPSPYEEEEAFESLKELEAQTIGNLLPDDDDLLSGVTDGFHGSVCTNNAEDVEDLDLFSSVGGLELGEDGSSQMNSAVNFNNELGNFGVSNVGHLSREIPSRTLIVRNISSEIEDSEIRTLFQQYGEIRSLYTSFKRRGFVMVSYYDIRAACNAMKALQHKQLLHRKLDIYFSLPKDNSSDKDINQGSLVVFNLDSSVSSDQVHEIFGAYGEIKEIRETPHRSLKFVEFYDARAAESALRSLNWREIAGRKIKLELAPPGGSKSLMQTLLSELEQEESGLRQHRGSPSSMTNAFPGSLSLGSNFNRDNGTVLGPFSTNGGPIGSLLDNMLHTGVSSSVPNSLSSLSRVESATIAESSHLRSQLNFDLQGMSNFHPRSFPEIHDGLANGIFGSPRTMAANITARAPEIVNSQQFRRVSSNGQSIDFNEVFASSGNGSCPPPGRHYLWNNNNPNHPQSQSTMWPNSPSFVNGITSAHSQQQLHAIPRAPSHMLNTLHPLNNHQVGSAPSMNPLWDRRQTYAGESPDATMFHHGSLGNMAISGTSPHPLEFVHHSMYPQTAGNGMDITIPSRSIGLHPHHQRLMAFPARGQMMPMMGSFDSPNERTRSRRHEGGTSQSDNKKQFELDLDRILQGEDKRTTLMIKNIPNKYTSKMLLAAIDERHKGTYDFIYLPIDFKNKCNVGYAFINMTEPSQIVPFYQSINGRKWEKFNSEKVATLAYARIQGKAALIAHFQNSSLMNEDKRCRPILFHTDGPNAGDQVPFPMGSNIRPRSGKVRANTSEENSNRFPSNSMNEDYYNGDLSSGSGKDSD